DRAIDRIDEFDVDVHTAAEYLCKLVDDALPRRLRIARWRSQQRDAEMRVGQLLHLVFPDRSLFVERAADRLRMNDPARCEFEQIVGPSLGVRQQRQRSPASTAI